jgi:hypothetical protein
MYNFAAKRKTHRQKGSSLDSKFDTERNASLEDFPHMERKLFVSYGDLTGTDNQIRHIIISLERDRMGDRISWCSTENICRTGG